MRGTVGNSSVSLHVYMPRDEEQSTAKESTSELAATVFPTGGSIRAPIVFPESRKTSVICQADHGLRRTVTIF
jgi:hypothetical protein